MSEHPVIDTLEANKGPSHGRRLSFSGSSSTVLDQVLRETATNANSHNTSSASSSSNTIAQPSNNNDVQSLSLPSSPSSPPLSTSPRNHMGFGPTSTSLAWQPLRSKSTNHAVHHIHRPGSGSLTTVHPTQHSPAAEQLARDLEYSHEHDKPSVLPKLAPGFKERLADVHHASLKSISDLPTSPSSSSLLSNSGNNNHNNNNNHKDSQDQHVTQTISQHPRHLSKSSILYESADVSIPGEKDENIPTTIATTPPIHAHGGMPHSPSLHQAQQLQQQQQQYFQHQQPQQQPSATLVQGGSGNRRWSHELSPEKAGLVGSVLEVAGLIKDVVLDKITHHGPKSTIDSSDDSEILFGGGGSPSSSTAASTAAVASRGNNNHDNNNNNNNHQKHDLTEQDRQNAARAAFGGGSDETGDQAVYYSGFKSTEPSSSAPTTESTAATTAPPPPPGGYAAQDLLASAPQAGQAHRHTMLLPPGVREAMSNPDVRKDLLLHHPEKLGYHSRDPSWVGPIPDHPNEDPVLARLGGQPGHAANSGGVGAIGNVEDPHREKQK